MTECMERQQLGGVLFYSCHSSDDELCKLLSKALSQLVREAHLSEWLEQEIPAGTEVAQERKSALEKATFILLLLSAEYLASSFYYQEMQEALERMRYGEVQVVPILLRPCDWENISSLAVLSPLPKDKHAVTEWRNQDAAFRDIALGIRQILGLQPDLECDPNARELHTLGQRLEPFGGKTTLSIDAGRPLYEGQRGRTGPGARRISLC